MGKCNPAYISLPLACRDYASHMLAAQSTERVPALPKKLLVLLPSLFLSDNNPQPSQQRLHFIAEMADNL